VSNLKRLSEVGLAKLADLEKLILEIKKEIVEVSENKVNFNVPADPSAFKPTTAPETKPEEKPESKK
jgi:hypothetical protein